MTKRLSRRDAWRKVAREFEKYANGAKKNAITNWGLCAAMKEVTGYWGMTYFEDKTYRPQNYDGSRMTGDWWKMGRKAAQERAIFAWLMSEVS